MLKKGNILFKENEESGATFIEILGVIAIIGILTVSGLFLYSYAMQKKTTNDLLYAANAAFVTISQDVHGKEFSSETEMNLFLANYTQLIGKYKISFYAIPPFPGNKFATNIELNDGSSMAPNICKGLILGMRSQHPIQALDVKAGETERHIEAGTIDVDAICGK